MRRTNSCNLRFYFSQEKYLRNAKKITTFDLFPLIFVRPFGWSVFEKESLDISKFHKSAEMSLSCQFSDKTWIDKEIHLKVQRKHTLTRFPHKYFRLEKAFIVHLVYFAFFYCIHLLYTFFLSFLGGKKSND